MMELAVKISFVLTLLWAVWLLWRERNETAKLKLQLSIMQQGHERLQDLLMSEMGRRQEAERLAVKRVTGLDMTDDEYAEFDHCYDEQQGG